MTNATVIPLPQRTEFEPWLSGKQLARHLGFSERWVAYRVKEGLPSKMFGGRRRFKVSQVESWLSNQEGKGA